MKSELIQLSFDKILQTTAYTVVILGGDNKKFAIYTEPGLGKMLQMFLTQTESPRPLTYDLMDKIFEGMNVRVKQVIINDVQDTVYYARLFLEQDKNDKLHILEIDARPSDCLALALMNNTPVYCTREVLDKILPIEE
jgi:bifunctional DNase/RNase